MPHFSPKVLIRADQLAQRYSVRPSTLLGVLDTHAAWCVDEASAIAGNLDEARAAKEQESTLEGPSGKVKLDKDEPDYPYIGTDKHGVPVIRGNIPIIPPPLPKS